MSTLLTSSASSDSGTPNTPSALNPSNTLNTRRPLMDITVTVWADKGGVGKSTLATSLAAELGATLVDLDPQGDGARWAALRGMTAEIPGDRKSLKALLASPGFRVVDCPPGQSAEAITAVEMADLLIIPTRTGEADMVALGRSLKVARRVRPEGRVGMVLNLARDTGRAKGIEAALRAQAGAHYLWLGRLCARVGAEEAYASGKTLLQAGGAVAYEFRQILESTRALTGAPVSPELSVN